LLTVDRFVDFPVSRGAKHSYDRTNAPPRKGPLVAKTKRLVVLVSGSGTNLQALLDAVAEAGSAAYGAEIVAVGADRDGIEGLTRA
jgi:phosphoribosylglycinamide formyltransferase-1